MEPGHRAPHPGVLQDHEDAHVQRLRRPGRVDVRRDGPQEILLMQKRIAKALVFVIALIPVALLVRSFLTDSLGANPAETIQLTTGRWALKFLLITLAVTPIRRLSGWNLVIQYRRMLGLFAFFYATLHFASWWAFDLGFAWAAIVGDILKRPFITLGFTAFLLLVPLAVTSTKGWIRRLGRKWTF